MLETIGRNKNLVKEAFTELTMPWGSDSMIKNDWQNCEYIGGISDLHSSCFCHARGIYSGQPEKYFPPPLKFFPVFVDFLRSWRYFNVCFMTFFFLLLFPSFFHEVLLQILPCFSIWTKIVPLHGQNIYLCSGLKQK